LTSARRCATSSRCCGVSASSASAVSARSSGSPAPTRPAIWRVHTASEVLLNTRRVKLMPPADCAAATTISTASGTSPWPRSWPRAALAFSASSKPLRVLPAASSASYL
jgi:hypothetical protein